MNGRYETLPAAMLAAGNCEKGYVFLEGKTPHPISFGRLLGESVKLAGKLQALGLQPGDRIILILPTSVNFAMTYSAAVMAGGVPCILPSPILRGSQEAALQNLSNTIELLRPKLLITSRVESEAWGRNINHCKVVSLDELVEQDEVLFNSVKHKPDDLALIQATSGSTAAPRGVALTHRNVMANLEQIGRRLEVHDDDVMVCWLPLFHDMGLIGCFLLSLYWQLDCVFMPPSQFLRRPQRWLEAVSDYGGTLSPAPNFAYALAQKRTPDSLLAELDLSSWRSAMCGAEPIDKNVLCGFAQRFSVCGFKEEALTPCYGMAEAALCVTMPNVWQGQSHETVLRDALVGDNIAVLADETTSDQTLTIVDCGKAVDGTKVRIVDENGGGLEDGHAGKIWVSGPSIMHAYFRAPEHTAKARHGEWLDTGDMGYMRAGSLFVLGRRQELIIIRGQNYYPTDFERAAIEIEGVRTGRIAAIGVYNQSTADTELHLILESSDPTIAAKTGLCQRLKNHVGERTGILPSRVVLVPRHTIKRTTSGKIKRTLLKSPGESLEPETVAR